MILGMCDVTISVFEFFSLFPDPEAARIFLEKVRWGDVPQCPWCDSRQNQHHTGRRSRSGYYRCYRCNDVYTVRTGTILHRSHIPLHKWLFTLYLIVIARKGISSVQLSKEIGVTQKTAWFMLTRIRQACAENTDTVLTGIVEADEAFFGGKEVNKHEVKKKHAGTGGIGKTMVLGMKQREGRALAQVIPDAKVATIIPLLHKHISPKSLIITDQHPTYHHIEYPPYHYRHEFINHSAREYVYGQAHINGMESVWAIMKRAFYGTYHHFSVKHLQRYLNEFTFRLDQGTVKTHIMDRITALLKKIFHTPHQTYQQLVT